MRQPLVAGNWKMNGSLAENEALIAGIKAGLGRVPSARVAVCPPFIYIPQVRALVQDTPILLGSQNVCDHPRGAFTGEVSAAMLREFGCTYAIVGHSERRHLYGESDALVAGRFVQAQAGGLVPILCVGELLEERERGETEQVVKRQLDAVLERTGIDGFREAVIAYEPVWAIGTGKTATPEQAQEVHAFIRGYLGGMDQGIAEALLILYGGSVKASNAGALFAQPDIDGGLIGGASLKAEEFLGICEAA